VLVQPAGERVAITADRILKAFEGRIARYKHPRDVVFVDQMPRNAMGKIQKFKLRELV